MKTKRKEKRYFFNPESLQYESVGKNFWKTTWRYVSLGLFSFVIAVIYYAVYSLFFDTPSENQRKRENIILKDQLAILEERYNILEKAVENISERDAAIYRTIFEAQPLNLAAYDNQDKDILIDKNTDKLIKEGRNKLDAASQKSWVEAQRFDSLKSIVSKSASRFDSIPSIMPVYDPSLNSIGASVGLKINPFFKSSRMHTGLDFAVTVGTEVVATANGTVSEIWFRSFGSGNRIVIEHGNEYETRYLYLNEINVKRGQSVKRGQVIGKVGNVGMTVPHLHYEVRRGGKITDPLNYFFMDLSPQQYQKALRISFNSGQSLD